jgi:hypothetical protein
MMLLLLLLMFSFQAKELELLQACSKDSYAGALLLTQMAPLQSDSAKQTAQLKVSKACKSM